MAKWLQPDVSIAWRIREQTKERTVFCDEREAVQGNALAVICPTMVHMDVGTGECTKKQKVGISGKIL